MKKQKKIIALLLTMVMIVMAGVTLIGNVSRAGEYEDLLDLYVYSESIYEVQPTEILSIYSQNSTGHGYVTYRYAHDVSKGTLIPIYCGEEYTDQLQDGAIDATDASALLGYSRINSSRHALEGDTAESENAAWLSWIADIRRSIVRYYEGQNINPEDIKVTVSVVTPAIESLNIPANTYGYVIDTDTGITEAVFQKMRACVGINEDSDDGKQSELQKITLVAELPNGKVFQMVVGSDNNFYLLEPASLVDEFATEMSYTALDETTADNGSTFLPPYTDNDNNKKDADVTVTIKSTTDEDIVAVVVGDTEAELTADGKANSLGWYYPDTTNKKVIAKVYPFDTYDNTTYNGKVSETVKVIGSEGNEDTQKPDIAWTFRRKIKEETTNDDGSITVVITYNLPVDKDSIPGDWAPIYDEDGATIHKITKTIKKGENYKKDVVVKQNGSDATNTTTVEKVWELPKTGDLWTIASVVLIVLIAFAVTRHRKMK